MLASVINYTKSAVDGGKKLSKQTTSCLKRDFFYTSVTIVLFCGNVLAICFDIFFLLSTTRKDDSCTEDFAAFVVFFLLKNLYYIFLQKDKKTKHKCNLYNQTGFLLVCYLFKKYFKMSAVIWRRAGNSNRRRGLNYSKSS